MTTLPCPTCAKANDVSQRMLYDRIHCAACGQWFLIGQRRNGTWYAAKVSPPVTMPKEER